MPSRNNTDFRLMYPEDLQDRYTDEDDESLVIPNCDYGCKTGPNDNLVVNPVTNDVYCVDCARALWIPFE